jgi:iron complex transport system substrate-binding protein
MGRMNLGALLALCLLASIAPAVAADFTLEIFGNANMDETIDEEDIEYVEAVIKGTNAATNLTDANYDGNIDEGDIEQIRNIIEGTDDKITFIDYDGSVETVHKPVNKIIATYSYHAWALSMLGADDKIVAIDETVKEDQDKIFPKTRDLPSIGSWSEYDAEKMLELKPDVVLIYTRDWLTEGSNPNLEKTIEASYPNCTVFACMPRDIALMKSEMAKLYYVIGAKETGNELFEWIDSYLGPISEKVNELSDEDKPRVFRTDNDQTFFHTYTGNSKEWELILEKAGGVNVAKDLEGDFVEIEPEWIIESNPDIIIVGDSKVIGYSRNNTTSANAYWEGLLNNAAINTTNAARDGQVYLMDSKFTMTEWFIGLPYLAKLLHPDLFEDLDPEAIHQEYLNRIRGLDYDLDQEGVFIYPPIEEDNGLAGAPEG